jgi:putative transposase
VEYAALQKAMKCLATDLEEVLTVLRFPEGHRKRIRTTNLLERLFGEGRRRSKVVPRFMSERSGLSLLFAVLVDASGTWHGIKITPAIGQELEGLTKNSGAKPSPQLAS